MKFKKIITTPFQNALRRPCTISLHLRPSRLQWFVSVEALDSRTSAAYDWPSGTCSVRDIPAYDEIHVMAAGGRYLAR